MWPSISVRLLQDPEVIHSFWGISRESWAIIAQWASAVAIAYAAWVASRYQSKKDNLARKHKVLSHLAILKLFNETVTAYFYVAFGGDDLPFYYNQTYILKQMLEESAKIEEMKDEIASSLPLKAIEPFQRFISYARTVDNVRDLEDKHMKEAWKSAENELHKVIAIIRCDNRPFPLNYISLWFYHLSIKFENVKKKHSKS